MHNNLSAEEILFLVMATLQVKDELCCRSETIKSQSTPSQALSYTGCSKKADPLVYFDDNFGKYGPILTIFSLLQQEIYDAQN